MPESSPVLAASQPPPDMPSFEAFYAAANDGLKPFPWQSRLAEQVRANGGWPTEIGIPTGLGKTACLDIAVWWIATEAGADPRQRIAPTRIWWVVNRRLLVDATHEHAEHIASLLRDPLTASSEAHRSTLAAVAARLKSLSGAESEVPLQIVRLRGGVAAGRPREPSQPSVILSTVPMFGSRLLFRGYGSSRSMRPIDAALAGTDSLVLVDEAHLAAHLMRLVPALGECVPNAAPVLREERSSPQIVSLTATGDPAGDRFVLDGADLDDATVQERLDAPKRLEVRNEPKGSGPKHLAKAAIDLVQNLERPTSCVVFTNTPACARDVFSALGPLIGSEADVLLLTGRNREREAECIRQRILEPGNGASARRADTPRKRTLIVVATQTLEVGADVDFEFLVTEQCGVRSLIQRLGRLNRLGRFPHSRATYVHLPPPKRAGGSNQGWPVYGEEPASVIEQLEREQGFAGSIDVSPRRVACVLGAPKDDPGRAPEILPALLWEWTKTSIPPPGEAPVEPYFSGIADQDRSVSLIWRCHVPPAGNRLWPRPRDIEAVDVPVREFREILRDDEVLCRLGFDGITIEGVKSSQLRPGDTVVLAANRGLLDEFGWAPESTVVVADDSLADAGLPLDAVGLRHFCGADLATEVARALQLEVEESDDYERASAASALIDILREHQPASLTEEVWSGFLSELLPQPVDIEGEVSRLQLRDGHEGGSSYDEFDEVSLAPEAVELDQHGAAVGSRARRIAGAVGVEPEAVGVIARAGAFHDLGKADRRFQGWLRDGEPGETALAKSNVPRRRWAAARAAAGWPRGGRHEELSARLVRNWLCSDPGLEDGVDTDLLLHLIVSHHGRGRPLVLPATDGTDAAIEHEIDGVPVSASADLARVDWEQPERFARLNARFGPWGVALLEAIVRQADHMVSAATEVR